MTDVKLTTASHAQKLATLADLVYEVASNAESLDSDKVEAIKTQEEVLALFSDLEYLKRHLDTALDLAREIAIGEITRSNFTEYQLPN